MYILGISAFYHDSAAAITHNGKVIAAAQEERFTRKKHDPSFPVNAIKYCLEFAGVDIDELEAVVFYDKPLLKFERLLETYYAFAPKGIRSFITAIPVWLREKMFLKREIKNQLSDIMPYDVRKLNLLFPEHHLSHAASTFYVSPYEEAAILTIDGVGEWATCSISHGQGNSIKLIKELRFPHSLGLLYTAVTYYLGFKVNSGEYKLMGLAPYGDPEADEVKDFIAKIKTRLIEIKDDGSLRLNQYYFSYATGLEMVHQQRWNALFGMVKRHPESALTQQHCNFAYAIQAITEDIMLLMAKEAQKLTGSKNICLAGGVALNCVANGKLMNAGIFENMFIQPAAGDAGGSLGAALAAHHIYFNKPRTVAEGMDGMQGAYLGPAFSNTDTERQLRKYNAVSHTYDDDRQLLAKVAALLADGKVVGWMHGRMEFGPRALGARSILGDPGNTDMQKKLNLKIKYRESFRPFAPSVLDEDRRQYFQLDDVSPYMLIVQDVAKDIQYKVPDNYHQLPIKDKLYFKRSTLPAITHIDYSARVQTVHRETNPRYHKLIEAFKAISGYGVVINTSFNVRGEPIVCTPHDAYVCFMRTEMDALVIGDLLFYKEEQPNWHEKKLWQEEFTLD
jgi:carbamoyltransferase